MFGNIRPAKAPAMAFKEERLAMGSAGDLASVGFAFTRALALTRGLLQRFNRGRDCTRRAHVRLDNSSERGRSGNGSGIGGGGGGRRRGGLLRVRGRGGFLQGGDKAVEACGKAFTVEIQRIVVTVANVGVEGGVKSRNEPASGAHAGDGVEQRQTVVLRGGKAGIGSKRVITSPARRAAARLNQLGVQEQALERAGKIPAKFKFGFAPRGREFVVEQHSADTVDDDMRLAVAVGAFEMAKIVDARSIVDVGGARTGADVPSAGVVDDEIPRQRRGRVVVVAA